MSIPNLVVAGTHGWTYEFKHCGAWIEFIRWNNTDGREFAGRKERIELSFCEPFEQPARVRSYLASFSTAGERVKSAVIKWAGLNSGGPM